MTENILINKVDELYEMIFPYADENDKIKELDDIHELLIRFIDHLDGIEELDENSIDMDDESEI